MKQGLLLITFCVLTAAMVPRSRRDTDEQEHSKSMKKREICSPSTPCGWMFYRDNKVIDIQTDNTYCQCDSNMKCLIEEDDTIDMAFIKRCKAHANPDFQQFEDHKSTNRIL